MLQAKDIWELAVSVIKWGSLLVGGTCLLVTSAEIGQFPEDMSAGEGLALYATRQVPASWRWPSRDSAGLGSGC